ncbi:hypothetical protein [Pedobacter sp. FW305-3-2-15-E-R2A2]|uniref:hypothetical protein n=1 Tax=Pedobacter sp. FW305-3-2-15-E-R2A2 TaxID=3140251 RepID=UPI0031405186
MKSKFIVVVTVLIAALVVYIFLRRSDRELLEVIKCCVTSNTGVVIPARLYSRVASPTIDGKQVRSSSMTKKQFEEAVKTIR